MTKEKMIDALIIISILAEKIAEEISHERRPAEKTNPLMELVKEIMSTEVKSHENNIT